MTHHHSARAGRLLAGLALLSLLLVAASAASAYSRDGKEDDESEVEKQVMAINEKLMALQNNEFKITMKISQAQQQAQQGLKNPGNAAQELAQGKRSTPLLRYKAVLLAAAKQVEAMDRQLLPLLKQAQALQKHRDKAPKMLQTQIDSTLERVQSKHRSNLEKMANFYDQAAAWGPALKTYMQVYQSIPEKERAKNQELIKMIGDVYDKAGSPRQALAFYTKVWEAKPEKSRYGDKKLAEKVGDLYAKNGMTAQALEIYRTLHDKLPENEKGEKDRKRVLKKINDVKASRGGR